MQSGRRDPERAPFFGWLTIAGIVVGYDAWAVASKRITLSEQFQDWIRRYWWFRTLGVVVVAHLFLGGYDDKLWNVFQRK